MIAGTAPISHFRQLERCPRAIRKYLRIPKIIMCNGIAPFVQIIELDVPYSISSIHGVQVSPAKRPIGQNRCQYCPALHFHAAWLIRPAS
jgi:hypothetical protein